MVKRGEDRVQKRLSRDADVVRLQASLDSVHKTCSEQAAFIEQQRVALFKCEHILATYKDLLKELSGSQIWTGQSAAFQFVDLCDALDTVRGFLGAPENTKESQS